MDIDYIYYTQKQLTFQDIFIKISNIGYICVTFSVFKYFPRYIILLNFKKSMYFIYTIKVKCGIIYYYDKTIGKGIDIFGKNATKQQPERCLF